MFLSGDRSQRELQLAELVAGYEEFNDFDTREIKWRRRCAPREWSTTAPGSHGAGMTQLSQPRSRFGQDRYRADQILALREQLALLEEEPLRLL